jgi:type IV pilus assembly protein PilX
MKTIASRLVCHRLTIVFDKHSRCEPYPNCNRTQSGVVLVISLIILLLLTIIGMSAMQTTSLEEKMAGNLRDKSLAFQMAESALRAAEVSLPIVSSAFTNTGTGISGLGSFGYGFYTDTPTISMADTDVSNDSFWIDNPVATSPITGLGNGIHSPDYIIQKLPLIFPLGPVIPGGRTYQPYKITVRATGGTTNAVVILQSIKIF